MTRGVHLGYQRSYFAVQVDDVLLPDSRWSTTGRCTPGDDCPAGVPATGDIRMVPADVSALRAWQNDRAFPLDLAFNAGGSVDAGGARDPLTASLLSQRNSFRWLNHTYSHQYLGCVQDFSTVPFRCATTPTGALQFASQATVVSEIRNNILWARRNGVPLQEADLVTGEHSGLASLPQQPVDNPALAPAFASLGIRWTASDASREPAQRSIGLASTVMRHPMNVFYNVATRAEQISEYNAIYTSQADGGRGICNSPTSTCITPLGSGGFDDYIVPIEAQIALGHVLTNNPRPHYAHQSNLTEDRLPLPGARPCPQPLPHDLRGQRPAAEPPPQRAGRGSAACGGVDRGAQQAGTVAAWTVDGRVTIDNRSGVAVPLTVPAAADFGSPYAGERSGWTAAATTRVASGQGAFGTAAPPAPADPVAVLTVDELVAGTRAAIAEAVRLAEVAARQPTAANRAAADAARTAAVEAARVLLLRLTGATPARPPPLRSWVRPRPRCRRGRAPRTSRRPPRPRRRPRRRRRRPRRRLPTRRRRPRRRPRRRRRRPGGGCRQGGEGPGGGRGEGGKGRGGGCRQGGEGPGGGRGEGGEGRGGGCRQGGAGGRDHAKAEEVKPTGVVAEDKTAGAESSAVAPEAPATS